MRTLGMPWVSLALVALAACGGQTAAVDAGDAQTSDVAAPTDAADAAADVVADVVDTPDVVTASCAGFVCTGGATCVVDGTAKCVCGSGQTYVAGACLADAFIADRCRLSCGELDGCGQGNGVTVDACIATCIAQAPVGQTFAKAVCVGMNNEHDGLWCGVLPACDALASGDTCATRCAAKQKCGFLAAPGITSGTSEGECEVLCRAYDTIYGNLKTTDSYAACLQKAATSCDPLDLALCEAYNGANLCGNVCGWLSSDKYCNYIPGRWADEAACTAECSAWTPGQANAVFGCYNKLNFAGCDHDKAVACFSPPTELPAGITALTSAVAAVCPDAMATDSLAANTWHFLGRTALWPAWMHDFGSAVACVEAMKSCPSHYDFDWLAPCFQAIAPDVTAACNSALSCLIQSPNKVPYLTVDGTTGMDLDRCSVAWQAWKTSDGTAFAGVSACLAKVDTSDCTAVNACITGGNPQGAACNDLVTCWDTAGSNPYGLPSPNAEQCNGLLTLGQDPKVADCVNQATDCAAKNACLPITALAPNAQAACGLLVPCWTAAGVNPFAALGKLTPATCAAATSVYNAKNPGVADMIFGCLQSAATCSAKMACLPTK